MKLYRALIGGAALIGSFALGYVAKQPDDEICRKQVEKVYRQVDRAAFIASGRVRQGEGFVFSPGGGYFYYPRGMAVLTEKQREEISDRLEQKLMGLNYFREELDEQKEDSISSTN